MPAPQYYFGPGNANTPLGTPDDKWAGINAKTATIDTFKNIGSKSMPVYFDENGLPQPATSIGCDDTSAAKYVILEKKDNGDIVLRPTSNSSSSGEDVVIATDDDIDQLSDKFA